MTPYAVLALLSISTVQAAAQAKPDSVLPRPSPLGAVVVSATRTDQPLRSLPAHVVVVGEAAIRASAAQTVPDLLRSIPGFTTRDFQSGLMSGPSQSIVSFRGLGGSSAGRTLVLLDGVPAGDPFTGWLDWGRIPLLLLQSAEVVRGGGSAIWGSRALGGVVNLRTVSPERDGGLAMFEGGSLGTYHGSGAASVRRGKVAASLGADFSNTDGFVILRSDQAGPVDRPAAMTNRSVSGKVTFDASPALRVWMAGGVFAGGDRPLGDEDHQRFSELRSGLRWLSASGGIATVGLFGNRRTDSDNSYTINSARTTQTRQRRQEAPASSTGISMQWTQMAWSRHELSVGADISSATGSLFEKYAFVADRPTRQRDVGGSQLLGGVFLQDAADLGHGFRLLASVRSDAVRNADGHRTVRDLNLGVAVSDTGFDARTMTRQTYSLGLRWQQASWLAWRGSVYEAFRAPSMYEMYQPRYSSRGGVTESNVGLDPEGLRGSEIGADFTPGTAFVARATAFFNRVDSPIMDVTLGAAGAQPTPIGPCGVVPAQQACAQRRNVDGLRSNGVESELEWRPATAWTLGAGYSYSPTRVSAPGQPQDGRQSIRSARHMASTRIGFDAPRWFGAAVEARYVGPRFDDDLNTIKLKEFYLVGLRFNRAIGTGVTAHLKIENLLDTQFEIARTRSGIADMGAPRWVTAGIRTSW